MFSNAVASGDDFASLSLRAFFGGIARKPSSQGARRQARKGHAAKLKIGEGQAATPQRARRKAILRLAQEVWST